MGLRVTAKMPDVMSALGCSVSIPTRIRYGRSRKLMSAAIVSRGFSSINQWPVFLRTIMVTSSEIKRACAPRAAPLALSPPIHRRVGVGDHQADIVSHNVDAPKA